MSSDFFAVAPERFLDRGFAAYLTARFGKAKAHKPPQALEQYEALWGSEPPEALTQMLSALREHGFPELAAWVPRFGPSEADIFNAPVLPRRGNVFADMLESDAATYQTPLLTQVLTASVFIGSSPSGDAWLYCSDDGYVYHVGHEDGEVSDPVATSLSAFVYAMALDDAASEDLIDARSKSKLVKSLKGHVSPALNESTQALKGALETEDQLATFLHQRGRWFCTLVREGGTAYDGAKAFDEEQNDLAPNVDERIAAGDTLPCTAIYLLLRAFFTDDRAMLGQLLQRYTSNRARLTSDATKLIADWIEGKNVKIGEIDDVRELAAEWREERGASTHKSARKAAPSGPIEAVLSFRGSSMSDNEAAYDALLKLREDAAADSAAALVPFVAKHTKKTPRGAITEVLRHAVRLLGESREPTALATLHEIAAATFDEKRMEDDSFPDIVYDAVVALGELNDASAAALFERIAKESENTSLQSAAACALLNLQGASALPLALEVVSAYGGLPDAELTSALGATAARADSKMRKKVVKLLEEECSDGWKAHNSLAALGALVSLGERKVSELDKAVKSALKKRPDGSGLPLMTTCEEEPYVWALRVGAAHGLVSAAALEEHAASKHFAVRLLAKQLLRRG